MDHDLELAITGDKEALGRLLEAELGKLHAYGLRMCGSQSDAEDVVQEVMLSATRHIRGFRHDAQFSTWLFKLARSACSKMHRRMRPEAMQQEAIEQFEALGNPEEWLEHQELRKRLEKEIQALPEIYREVLMLRDMHGMSTKEAAYVTGLSGSAVKSRLHRARAMLVEQVSDLAPMAQGSQKDCPDVMKRWSEMQEGDLDDAICQEMQAHLQLCPSCERKCEAMSELLLWCGRML